MTLPLVRMSCCLVEVGEGQGVVQRTKGKKKTDLTGKYSLRDAFNPI